MSEPSDIAARLDARLVSSSLLTGGVSAHVTHLVLARPDGTRLDVVLRQHDAGDMRREAAVQRWIRSHGACAPEPLLVDDDGTWMVLAYVPGRRADARDVDAMGHYLARLHALPMATAPALPSREAPDLRPWLPANHPLLSVPLPKPEGRGVLHGDFWPGNLRVHEDGICALDWEDAAVGDPLCDVAGARVELTWAFGEAAAEQFTRAYASLAGAVDATRLARWEAFTCAAGLAHVDQWGLPEADVQRMRERGTAILERVTRTLTGA